MRKSTKYLILFVILVCITIYVATNKDFIIREHLTSGPPTLASLQTDTQDLEGQIKKVSDNVNQMMEQAKAQGAQAAAAKAQLTAAKAS